MNGTVVLEWGEDVPCYVPDPPGEQLTFVPKEPSDRSLRIWKAWKDLDWFKKKRAAYLYDIHFAPGGLTDKHYREWADRKGMKIGYESDLPLNRNEVARDGS